MKRIAHIHCQQPRRLQTLRYDDSRNPKYPDYRGLRSIPPSSKRHQKSIRYATRCIISLEVTANSSNEWQNAPVATIVQIDQPVRLEAVEKSPRTVKYTMSKIPLQTNVRTTSYAPPTLVVAKFLDHIDGTGFLDTRLPQLPASVLRTPAGNCQLWQPYIPNII